MWSKGSIPTNLLFPWVVSGVLGFDTGIAIANTSGDDAALGATLGATATSGPCTLTGFPAAGGTAVQFTTPSVAAAATQTLLLSGTAGFSGFSGHIIAVCRFLNAHAFTFIVDGLGGGAPRVAEGYLALVLPNPRPAVAAGGEILGH